ncbi:uncharacterized protein DSM5745_04521 [Aspergillus mulundensis]|uniref:O-methyltransferase C-terminal domain-containing protein n=1 Tax=Aspergillus mulundensis TaxID=1810919 RepID=A0A3D8SCX3_9EURO|nr:Uncharacterized protein DSM5745_04521 [Aspergillus mulundensis]RDW84195.1 Uncharacterized protein DSM5745_04521 [Aspergillus mulundensis]
MEFNPGESVFTTVALVAPLGFAPVAVRFRLFGILSELDRPVTGQDVLDAYIKGLDGASADIPPVQLIVLDDWTLKVAEGTLVAMQGLSWVTLAGEDLFRANKTTHYLAKTPSALHGILHFTTEVLLGSAFLMRKLESTGFSYPFTPLSTPVQHAHHLMGDSELEKMHTYSIMAAQGRMDSFNTFMQGRFEPAIANFAERLVSFGYDLNSVVEEARAQGHPVTIVDIGGGRGDLLLDIKGSIPGLQAQDLVLQELDPETMNVPGLTVMKWDYAAYDSPQPIQGALVYCLSAVLHNLPDENAVALLRKIRDAMAPYSRILAHERLKERVPMSHATMTVLYGGRERSASEWRVLAGEAGLQTTFMAWPDGRAHGVVEMRRA